MEQEEGGGGDLERERHRERLRPAHCNTTSWMRCIHDQKPAFQKPNITPGWFTALYIQDLRQGFLGPVMFFKLAKGTQAQGCLSNLLPLGHLIMHRLNLKCGGRTLIPL